MMTDTPFYITDRGPNVLTKSQILAFQDANPDLSDYLAKHPLELRLLDYPLFESLCYWIIGQQISARVATSIIQRFHAALNPIDIEKIYALTIDELKVFGLSKAKASYIKNTAQFFIEEGEPNLSEMTSQEAVQTLTQVKGIGEWTAQMHLIFCEGKMDILAIKDLVVRQGLQEIHGLNETPSIKEATEISQHWGKLATIGTLLCWAMKGE